MAELLHIDGAGGNTYGQTLLFQSFTATDIWVIDSVWVERIWLNTAANCILKVYKDEGGNPDSGTLMGTSDAEALGGGAATEETFTFSSPFQTEADQKYYLIWYPQAPAGSVYIYRTDTSVYAGGGIGYSTDGGSSWVTTDESLYDIRQLKILGAPPATTNLIDLKTETKGAGELIKDLLSSVITQAESIEDLNTIIAAGGTALYDFNTEIAAEFLTGFNDLKTEIQGLTYNFKDLKTEITVLRSKWWLNTEIKAGCSAKWSFNTEWNPNRFLSTEIAAKKPYEFNFDIQTGSLYSATTAELELLVSGYANPIRTLFLDYLQVGGENEYTFQLWWARGLVNKNTLKNAKIKAEYINTLDSGGYEVVTCDWLSCKVGTGDYSTVNETALTLGDVLCDSKLDITLKINCRDCSITRGLVFFKLIFTGDYKESIYGETVVYRNGAVYHSGLFDDYTSNEFICRLYVVGS
jgi:hypothetical protein